MTKLLVVCVISMMLIRHPSSIAVLKVSIYLKWEISQEVNAICQHWNVISQRRPLLFFCLRTTLEYTIEEIAGQGWGVGEKSSLHLCTTVRQRYI